MLRDSQEARVKGAKFMRRRRLSNPIHHEDPMSMMGNLFDIALLIGIGLFIMALSSFGLSDLLTNADTTLVKNPGKPDMEIVTRAGGKITRLKQTGQQSEGPGTAVGTVYRLQTGEMIWVPETGAPSNAVPGESAPLDAVPSGIPSSPLTP